MKFLQSEIDSEKNGLKKGAQVFVMFNFSWYQAEKCCTYL